MTARENLRVNMRRVSEDVCAFGGEQCLLAHFQNSSWVAQAVTHRWELMSLAERPEASLFDWNEENPGPNRRKCRQGEGVWEPLLPSEPGVMPGAAHTLCLVPTFCTRRWAELGSGRLHNFSVVGDQVYSPTSWLSCQTQAALCQITSYEWQVKFESKVGDKGFLSNKDHVIKTVNLDKLCYGM